jgi:hypothetical protein
MKKLIEQFLKDFADEWYEMPDHALELLMDDHFCIEWNGIDYFVPENCSDYTEDDEMLYDYLKEFHGN